MLKNQNHWHELYNGWMQMARLIEQTKCAYRESKYMLFGFGGSRNAIQCLIPQRVQKTWRWSSRCSNNRVCSKVLRKWSRINTCSSAAASSRLVVWLWNSRYVKYQKLKNTWWSAPDDRKSCHVCRPVSV